MAPSLPSCCVCKRTWGHSHSRLRPPNLPPPLPCPPPLAAKKKHAEVRLDGVLAYGQRCIGEERGYYMMDSPGNDLESIAGQVR